MKQISVTVNYKVPSWNFCNVDAGASTATVCKFCNKEKGAFSCLLYSAPLKFDGTFIEKTIGCRKNTAGFGVEIEMAQAPSISPREIITETLKSYKKIFNDLLNQGYPRALAEAAAQKYVLGDD